MRSNVSLSATQRPVAELSPSAWDVVVIGAGPAGGAAAAALAAGGVQVLLVDRLKFPREKVCGDGLVPESITALKRIGIDEDIRALGFNCPGYTLVSPSGAFVDLKSEVTVLPRRVLDNAIAAKSVENGAAFAQGDFKGVHIQSDGELECIVDDRRFRSRVLIVAPGADLGALATLGIKPTKPEGVAIRQYFRASRGPNRPYFFLREDFLPGYAWIFPAGDDYYNVGCGRFLTTARKFNSSLVAAYDAFLKEDPVARDLVGSASEKTPIRGASLRCGMRSLEHAQKGRVLLAGEAIGTTISGWGEGVSKAMETGLLAAEVALSALRANDFALLENYRKRLDKEIKPDIDRHTRVTAFFNRAWTANLLVQVVRRIPGNWL
jgi:geranylgeranyl reductase family protein